MKPFFIFFISLLPQIPLKNNNKYLQLITKHLIADDQEHSIDVKHNANYKQPRSLKIDH